MSNKKSVSMDRLNHLYQFVLEKHLADPSDQYWFGQLVGFSLLLDIDLPELD